jgi:hypothetical protein
MERINLMQVYGNLSSNFTLGNAEAPTSTCSALRRLRVGAQNLRMIQFQIWKIFFPSYQMKSFFRETRMKSEDRTICACVHHNNFCCYYITQILYASSTWIYVDLCSKNCSRTGALTAMNVNIIFLWHVTPYGFLYTYKFSEERAVPTLTEDNSSSLNMDASDISEIRYLSNQTTRRHIPGNPYLNSYGHNTEFINFLYHTWNSVQAGYI